MGANSENSGLQPVRSDQRGRASRTWFQANHRVISLAVVASGLLLWVVARVLAIPLPWWRERFSDSAAEFVGALNPGYQLIFGPLLALGLTGLSAYMVYCGMRQAVRDWLSIGLAAVGLILSVLFLGYQALGFILLVTMDF